jgi:hypothetical protein
LYQSKPIFDVGERTPRYHPRVAMPLKAGSLAKGMGGLLINPILKPFFGTFQPLFKSLDIII